MRTMLSMLILACGLTGCLLSNYPTYSRLSRKEQQKVRPLAFNLRDTVPLNPTQWSDIRLASINQDQLLNEIRKNGKRLNLVLIVTSGCGGTPYAIRYLKEVEEKYNQDVATYLLFSDDYATMDKVKKALFTNQYFRPSYIIDNSYGEFISDSRKKGQVFRNTVCKECKSDIIGVPYRLVLDKQLKVVLHGYPGYKDLAHVPSDFIGWLLKDTNLATR